MGPIRRGSAQHPRDVVAFLNRVHPGAAPKTHLHAVICWVYHDSVFDSRSEENVRRKAGDRGVTPAKFDQIIAGDLNGINWYALEAVLASCGATKADLQVAQDLFDQIRQGIDQAIPDPPPPLPPRSDQDEDWAPLRTQPALQFPSWPPATRPLPLWPRPADEPAGDGAVPATPGTASTGKTDTPDSNQKESAKPAEHNSSRRKPQPPDPATATNPGEYVALMKKFRIHKGERPYREMASVAEHHPQVTRPYSYASFQTIGNNGKLPKRELVRAYIAGAGGSNTEIDQWIEAHQRLSVS